MQRVKRANELVKWVNDLLDADERTLDDLKNGVSLVQIVHSLDPDAVDLSRVDFQATNEYYYQRNLKVLQGALAKSKVMLDFNLAAVAQGEKRNDLYGLVSYLKLHYDTYRTRINSPSAVKYDAKLERRRAQERRNAKHMKQFRVAQLPGTADRPPSSSGMYNDSATVTSDHSQAMSSYTTLSARHRCTRMKLRSEELERWANSVQLPLRRVSSFDAIGIGGATVDLRTPTKKLTGGVAPSGAGAGRVTAPRLSLCEFADFEPIHIGEADLCCMNAWPGEDLLDADTLDPHTAADVPSSPHRGRSPTKTPHQIPRMTWAAFDAALADIESLQRVL
jgi:hypothetical protein